MSNTPIYVTIAVSLIGSVGLLLGIIFSILYGVDAYIYENYDIAKCDITYSEYVPDTCSSCDSNNNCDYYDCSYYSMSVDVYTYAAENNMTGNVYLMSGHFSSDYRFDRTYGALFPCWYDRTMKSQSVKLSQVDDPTWKLVMLIIGWSLLGVAVFVGVGVYLFYIM